MPNEIFDLERNDETVSSFYTLSDLVIMINNRLTNENQITEDYIRQNYGDLIHNIENVQVIDENSGFKTIWGPRSDRKIPTNWKLKPRTINHYELVLYNIFIRFVGSENVYLQYKIDGIGHGYDFMVEYNGLRYLIEFEGIGHYREHAPDNPLTQLDEFNHNRYKLVLWPYWIQRCERNLKVILGIETKGLGAIWGSDYHFGDFPWENSCEIIKRLNGQFHIERNGGIGYVYESETEGRNNGENPVIENILNPRKTAWTRERRLIPKGTHDNVNDINYWLPGRLKYNKTNK